MFQVKHTIEASCSLTHIFISKYYVNPLECFKCLLMFLKLNYGNGLDVFVKVLIRIWCPC